MPSVIYLVEDDGLQGDLIIAQLATEFGPNVEVVRIPTEREFYVRLDEIASSKPRGIIIDQMLQFDQDALEVIDEVQDYMKAGQRCIRKLKENPTTAAIPILQYTVLDKNMVGSLPDGASYLRKDKTKRRLFNWVRSCL